MRKCKLCPLLIPWRRTSGLCPACQKRRNNRRENRARRERERLLPRCPVCRAPGAGLCGACSRLHAQIREAHAGDAAGPPVLGQAERIGALAELAREKAPLFKGPRKREVCRAC